MFSKKVLFGFTIITMVVMKFLDIPLKNIVAPKGIVSFELAKTLPNSIEILNSWDMHAKLYAGLSLGFDYLFMLMYSLLFYKIILYFSTKYTNNTIAKYVKGLALLMIFAGIFDAIENYSLIQLYIGNLDQMFSSIAFYSATIKFSFLGLGIIFIILNSLYILGVKLSRK